jgi:hypothetical protein
MVQRAQALRVVLICGAAAWAVAAGLRSHAVPEFATVGPPPACMRATVAPLGQRAFAVPARVSFTPVFPDRRQLIAVAQRIAHARPAEAHATLVAAVLAMTPWTTDRARGAPADLVAGPPVLVERAIQIARRSGPGDAIYDLRDVLACMAGDWTATCEGPGPLAGGAAQDAPLHAQDGTP